MYKFLGRKYRNINPYLLQWNGLYKYGRCTGYSYSNWKVQTSFKIGYFQLNESFIYGFSPIAGDSVSNNFKENMSSRFIYMPQILGGTKGVEKLGKLSSLYDEIRVYGIRMEWKPDPKEKQLSTQSTAGIFYFDDKGSETGFVCSYDNGMKFRNKTVLPLNETNRFIWINLKDSTGKYGNANSLVQSNTGAFCVAGVNDSIGDRRLMTNVGGTITFTVYLRCRRK